MENRSERMLQRRQARQLRRKRNRELQGGYLLLMLTAFVLIWGIIGLLTPDRAFSDNENRVLAQRPKLSLSKLLDGSFTSDLEAYDSDQFVGRDGWVSLKLAYDRLLGAKEENGVYLCRDGYLMEKQDAPDERNLQKNEEAMRELAEAFPSVKMHAAIIPNAVTVCADKLPRNAPVTDQRRQLKELKHALDGLDFIDVTETLCAHGDEGLFYRTDHHWTSLGAKYAFEAMAPSLGLKSASASTEYDVYRVSNSFEGTLASRSGSHGARDAIDVYIPKTDVSYIVSIPDEQRLTCSLYSSQALEGKDQYAVFLGGNHPQVDIRTTSDTGRVLLMFKDSYANCLVPFLVPYYDRILMIDARYYYDGAAALLNREGVTDVLYLYNLNTFLTDKSLADVLTSGLNAQPPQTQPSEP
mgnify:CR=1 FL=1